jgi:hypothetical protein
MSQNVSCIDTIVFHEPSYPHLYSEATLARLIPGEFELVCASELPTRLSQEWESCRTLISLHGPYFPKASWSAIRSFLEAGGNLVVFGGTPFTRPVRPDGTIEPEQQAYTDQLYLGAFFQLDVADEQTADLKLVAAESAAFLADCPLSLAQDAENGNGTGGDTFWSCYPKLCQVSDHPEDMGSAGPLDTLLTPLLFARRESQYGTLRAATPAFLLDQQHGRFQGGRWLISVWQPASEQGWRANEEAIRRMIELAIEGCTILDVRPGLACYRAHEAPSLVVTARSYSSADRLENRQNIQVSLTLHAPLPNREPQSFAVMLPASTLQQETMVPLPALEQPGLYRVEVRYTLADGLVLSQETGFWLWSEELVEATHDKCLTAGRDYLYQQGEIFALFGTTYMDSRVQRKFLHLPNPARWDADFAEMKAAGINLIRTGIWTAWREFMPIAGVANEAMLRALDAFVMTACKHDLQVIFTFFSFFPPLFEGENPWLDPRSLQGQRDFVATLSRRYTQVHLLSWDLINEPSFGDPHKIFAERAVPNYDRFELAAFRHWLAQRYTLPELQVRWRQTPADLASWEQVTPPASSDYSFSIMDSSAARNRLKVLDYTHFSQEMFAQWAADMYATIRASGNQMLVGVGQDEGRTRPAAQFYAPAVDYTTTHPWWNNDDLLWDMLLDKTLNKPNLIQETGVMLVRDVDGRPWRSERECAHLLERKLITGLIGRGAGLIQWLWHINSYMDNDNENSIGLVRADGSAKPELEVMLEIGRLMQALQPQLSEPESVPEVWLVVPYSQWFLRSDLVLEVTRRAIRVLGYDLGIIPQVVGEHQLSAALQTNHRPRCLIVPGLQTFSEEGWQALSAYVERGATLFVSGVVTRDTHNLIVQPDLFAMAESDLLNERPVCRYAELALPSGEKLRLSFGGSKIGYVRTNHDRLISYKRGEGQVIWSGLPLELSDSPTVIWQVYCQILEQAGIIDGETQPESPLLVARKPLKDGTLILIVSESAIDQQLTLEDAGIQVTIAPNRAGAIIVKENAVIEMFGGVAMI